MCTRWIVRGLLSFAGTAEVDCTRVRALAHSVELFTATVNTIPNPTTAVTNTVPGQMIIQGQGSWTGGIDSAWLNYTEAETVYTGNPLPRGGVDVTGM